MKPADPLTRLREIDAELRPLRAKVADLVLERRALAARLGHTGDGLASIGVEEGPRRPKRSNLDLDRIEGSPR